jgi:enamine deaminase RidA (YjgF/YER057c/UK114 family)
MSKRALLPQGWPRPRGYANGVSARGRTIFVAGMIGWNARNELASDRLADQAKQALANVVAVLEADGALPSHIVRMTWYVTDKREYIESYAEIGRAFREIVGEYDIAMTAVEVSALIEDGAKVEIEVTAVVEDC